MSITNPPGHRYLIKNIEFLPGDQLVIAYNDPDDPEGPVLIGHRYAEIDCIAGDMREQLWDTLEALCDIMDGAYQAQRSVERTQR